MRKINVGIIGGGMIGEVHINSLIADGRANITWLTTRNKKVLKSLVGKFKIKNFSDNYKDMLKDPELDAVIVATPPFTHFEIGKEVIKSNKHLIMEKPLVINKAELTKFMRMVKNKKDKIIMECSARHARLQPKFPFIKKLIESGIIGEIYHIDHRHLTHGMFIEYNPKGSWALEKSKSGGGPFIDWGVYDLSFHLGLFDDKLKLNSIKSFMKANLRKDLKTDIEQHGAAYMQFSNRISYYYERGSGVTQEVQNQTIIFGTNGTLKFSFCSWDSAEIEIQTQLKNGKVKTTIKKINMKGHKGDNEVFATHIIDCVLGKTKPELPIEIAAKNLNIIFDIMN